MIVPKRVPNPVPCVVERGPYQDAPVPPMPAVGDRLRRRDDSEPRRLRGMIVTVAAVNEEKGIFWSVESVMRYPFGRAEPGPWSPACFEPYAFGPLDQAVML